MSDCEICKSILRMLTSSTVAPEIPLGTFEQALDSNCPRHTPLIASYKEYCLENGPSEPDGIVCVLKPIDAKGHIHMRMSFAFADLRWRLLLNWRSVPGHIGIGRVFDPDWVDLDLVKQWKQRCFLEHGPRCENPMKIWPVQPAWLVDVEKRCVVPGQEAGAYFALSYRWGQVPESSLNSDGIFAKLQDPNSLDTPDISRQVSPTVRHAMHLVSVLGERYLWVDALCIDHRNKATTTQQLSMMGAIYANALVTIIATDGDSQTGIVGLKGVSSPRNLKQRVIPFGDEDIIVRNTHRLALCMGVDYYNRGWTFQESMMAQRKIFFNQKEAHWECECSVSHEETILSDEYDTYKELRFESILAGFPDPVGLGHILQDYNQRHLSYDEDALPGISGLLSVASRSFTGGFLFGLPIMFFDQALGWRPHRGPSNLRRRVQSSRPPEEQLTPSDLPSWSWIGWDGEIQISTDEAIRMYGYREMEETIPVTEWYTCRDPYHAPRKRIHSTWFENRETFKDLSNLLPAGWTRHSIQSKEDRPAIIPDGCGGWVFKHRNWTKHHNWCSEDWYYPFPVQNISASILPNTPDQTPYLICQTKKASLYAKLKSQEEMEIEERNTVELWTQSEKKVGILHLHNQQQLSELFPIGTEVARGTLVELAAIYRSRKYSREKVIDQNSDISLGPQTVRDTYEVLWLEWKDGIAYRLGIGSVDKDAWENLDLEDILLVLG